MWRLVALLGLAACGGSPPATPDAGVDAARDDDGGVAPLPPDPPEAPAPPAAPRVGGACPEGEWAAVEADGRDVVYVRAGEPAGGDGSEARPLGTIADALVVAPDGATVALSRGRFSETFAVERAVMLRGACTSETVLETDEPDFGGALAVLTGDARGLATLTLTGVRRAILVDGALGEVLLEQIVVDAVEVSGLTVLGASVVRASDLAIRDVAAQSGYSVGIEVAQGSTLELVRASVERATAAGLLVYGATTTARDLAILDTRPEEPEGTGGDGIVLLDAAALTLERALVEGSLEWGIAVRRAGTRLDARDVLVKGVAPRARDGGEGIGVFVDGGASVTLARAAVEDTAAAAVRVAGEASAVDATDLATSAAIEARGGATASARRLVIQGGAGTGAVALDGGRLELADARVEDVSAAGGLGHCAAVAREGSLRLERFVLARCAIVGLQIGPGGLAALTDGTIADSAVGVNAQEPGWDDPRLGDGILLTGNQRDWSDEALPVPP